LLAYGSEKKLWVDEVTTRFNGLGVRLESGKSIHVEARAMGSMEAVEEAGAGRLHAHMISPASGAAFKLANAKSRTSTGRDLVGETKNLLLSPVVIAMWRPMAEKLGWPEKPIGWSDVLALAKDDRGWAKYDSPQWGRLKFGHTHPEYSNSGLISIIAATYAGAGKQAGLTLEDAARPAVREYVGAIEQAVVHYGESTGFFGRKMFENGPEYLSAAVLYENMVIESYDRAKYQTSFPVVAIYPKEGTFWCEHPIGVVEREWVSEEAKEGAQKYIEFLMQPRQQERGMALGFRPADVSIKLGAPVDADHGVDPSEPKTVLETPGADVIGATVDAWKIVKKKSNVVLVLDTSGSMKEQNRMENAKSGAAELLAMLGDEDTFSLLTFNDKLTWVQQGAKLKDQRARAGGYIKSLFPGGGTALYDAVADAWRKLEASSERDKISAIVVLTDGADTDSKLKLESLIALFGSNVERSGTRIFTIGYGGTAKAEILKAIADATNAKFYEGKAENIRQIFKEIATFF